ncbi:MAG: restriction endonuclease subunit S [Methylococcales bacterium]|nr:restriction endonuclease subunit S [Methylococcales bacterium]
MSDYSFPAEWKTLPLKATSSSEHHSFIDGDWIEAHHLSNKGIRLIQTGNIGIGKYLDKPNTAKFISTSTFDELGCKKIKGGDILICRLAEPVGRACIIPEQFSEAITSVDCTIFRPNSDILDKSFINHWLSHQQHLKVCEDLAGGSTRQRISRSSLGRVVVPVPQMEEQKAIATILDTLDEAIDAAEAMLAKQEKMKQGLLQDLLTRGVDDNGQLRPHYHERPDLYQQTELGWIPRFWSINLLDEFAVKIQDGTHFSPKTGGGHYLYITSKNIRFGFIDLSNVETIDEAQHIEIYRRCDVKQGDLLLTKDGANTGNAAINTINEPISLLSSVAFIRLDSTKDIALFHLQYLLSQSGQRRLKDLMSGNAITRLTLKKIRNFEVPRPTVTEQKMIADILALADDEINTLRAERNKLLLIKTGLMQDLLTGRRRVTPELIRQVESLSPSAA